MHGIGTRANTRKSVGDMNVRDRTRANTRRACEWSSHSGVHTLSSEWSLSSHVGQRNTRVACRAPSQLSVSLLRTRITTCYPDRVEPGPYFVPGLPHVVAHCALSARSPVADCIPRTSHGRRPSWPVARPVLGYWGNTMRDAVRNMERWKRRRAPTQDPSTDRVQTMAIGSTCERR